MINLTPYADDFNRCYPRYADRQYQALIEMAERYGGQNADVVDTPEFIRFANLLEPLIEIKNYKSQIPFPTNIGSAVRAVILLKQLGEPDPGNEAIHELFIDLIQQDGFQLPTVSALFHFCHPDHFPIVDRNVEAACIHLKEMDEKLQQTGAEGEFEFDAPRLPTVGLRPQAKLERYRDFICFLNRVRRLQHEQHDQRNPAPDYRFVDKALMVLGVERYRNQVDQGL